MSNLKSLQSFYPRRFDVPLLILSSVTVLLFGLSLPLLTVEKNIFWRHWENHYSVFTGVVELARHGDVLLAVVVFFFSMIFPFAKLTTLSILWYRPLSDRQRMAALQWLEVLGRWSMLDVFAVAILIVAAKMRDVTQVEPRIGVYLFGTAIVLSMLTTAHVERLARRQVAPAREPAG